VDVNLFYLGQLMKGHRVTEPPAVTRRAGRWVECVIGIGDNEVAFLSMTDDAYAELQKLSAGAYAEVRVGRSGRGDMS